MIDTITDALERIVESGGFLVVSDPSRENLYVQFVADGVSPEVDAELVGNAHLPPEDRLALLQQAELRDRGWAGDGEENWTRTWPDASTEVARLQLASEALGALHEVYGASGQVEVEVHVEGAEASTEVVQGRSRVALLVAVAVALLAFGVALVVSVAQSP